MIEVSFLSLLILGELLVLLSLACGISLFLGMRRRKRDLQAARKLVTTVQQEEEQHKAFISKRLASGYGYEGEELEQTVKNLVTARKLLYQTFINVYLKRDATNFGNLNIPLQALIGAYQQLKVPDGSAGSVSEVDLEYLRDKNQRLSDELGETMDTMGRLLTEYSNIFAERSEKASDGAGEESFENAVERLLEDVDDQVEDSVESLAVSPETKDRDDLAEAHGQDDTQIASEEDLSGILDDLEEIDIDADVDILPGEEEGKGAAPNTAT